jgi:proteasome accessory factor B
MGVSRVHRLLRLITLLQSPRARTAAELMRELEISRRTLFRDLNMLELAGVPYYHEAQLGYRIKKSFFLPPISLTVTETLGLMMLGKSAAGQRQRPLTGQALSAIYKLLSTVPEPIRSACGEMMANVSISSGAQLDGDVEAKHYPVLQQCVDEARVCRMRYHSPAEPGAMEVLLRPYALHFAARAWYVMGATDQHREVRLFKLLRIETLQLTSEIFARPKNFSVARKLGNAWQLIPEGKEHQVELIFSARVARNVSEVRWHPTQKHKMLADGRCRMTFTVDGLNEIAWWICGYADQVVVQQPAPLRERVRTMLGSALAHYESSLSGMEDACGCEEKPLPGG